MTLTDSFKFNKHNFKISQSKTSLSNDAGSSLIQIFMLKKLNIKQFFRDFLPVSDNRKFYIYSNEFLFVQVLTLLIQGYHVDVHHSVKRNDEINKLCWGNTGSSQPTISRFLERLSHISHEIWNNALIELATQFFTAQGYRQLVLDIDSTHFDTYGYQEKTAFNSHYGTMGYHPLIITETQSGLVLPLLLRSGERYTSYNAEKVLEPLIEALEGYSLILRGDSGFATPAICSLSEHHQFDFVIRLKKNSRLNKLADEAIDPVLFDKNIDHEICSYEELDYRADTWKELDVRVVSEAKRPANELVFDTTELVTSFKKLSIEDLFRFYRQRGEMENIIKELRELKKLAELKIVRVAKYNISKFNHTKWYSLDEEKLQEYLGNKTPECRNGQIGQVECPKEDNGNGKSGQFRTGQVDHFKDNKVPKNTSLNNQQKIKEILECFKEVTGQVFDKDKMGNKID